MLLNVNNLATKISGILKCFAPTENGQGNKVLRFGNGHFILRYKTESMYNVTCHMIRERNREIREHIWEWKFISPCC